MMSRSAAPAAVQGRLPMQLPDRVVYDPPWDQINFEQAHLQHRPLHAASESDEDNRHAQHRYSHTGRPVSSVFCLFCVPVWSGVIMIVMMVMVIMVMMMV